MNRRQARENVFYLVFETEFQKEEINSADLFQTAQDLGVIEYDEFTERVFFGVMAELENIDKKIEENAKGWKLERISRVSLAIMRICVYEMLYCEDVPFNISINEAVELAKKYSSDDGPSFVNGILAKVVK